MADELGGNITEYVSNGPKNYAYRTGDGIQMVKCFTLNFVASRQLTFDVMKEMAISEQGEHIIVTEWQKIRKDLKRRQINTLSSSKLYQIIFDKRVRHAHNHTSLAYGYASSLYIYIYIYIYILSSCTIKEQHSVSVCVVHIDILYYSLIYYISPVI